MIKPDKRVRVLNPFVEQLIIQNFTQVELDLFFFLLGKLTKSHQDETVYTLKLEELANFAGHSYNLDNFVEAARQLRKKEIIINDDKRILIDGLLSSAEFMKGKRLVEITVSKKMKPFLIGLTYNYTSVQLFSLVKLKSVYAKRIYLYFTHPDRKPKKGIVRANFHFTIKDFKSEIGLINDAGQEMFTRISDFKRKVLVPAKEQINEWSDIKLQYKMTKFGREFFYIDWDIERNDNKHLLPEYEQPIQLELPEETFTESIEKLSIKANLIEQFKVREDLAEKTARMIDSKMLHDMLKGVSIEAKKGTIKDIGAYTAGIIYNKWGLK